MTEIFVIIKFTKITKIFDHGNLELYGIAASLVSILPGFWEITEDQNTGSYTLHSSFKLPACKKMKPMVMMEGPMFKFGNTIIHKQDHETC